MDGETEVILGVAVDVDPGVQATFDGILETPRQAVIVATVEHTSILQTIVPTKRTRVRIWTNDRNEPDRVQIGLG
jgi:hypothetical protein